MSAIPELSRSLVTTRDRYLCVRCGMKGSDWHHRRGRAVVDEHTHCPCNGVLLCRTCHHWAHLNPFLARGTGLIVSRYTPQPGTVELQSFIGAMNLDCDGGFQWSA